MDYAENRKDTVMDVNYVITCVSCKNTGDQYGRFNICISTCPNKAIQYEHWSGGTASGCSPKIDKNKCVDCGECFQACDEVSRIIGNRYLHKNERM